MRYSKGSYELCPPSASVCRFKLYSRAVLPQESGVLGLYENGWTEVWQASHLDRHTDVGTRFKVVYFDPYGMKRGLEKTTINIHRDSKTPPTVLYFQ